MPANTYGVYLDGQDKSEPFNYLQILDLQADGSVNAETGPWIFEDPDGYQVDDVLLEAFDKTFPPKEKQVLPGQLGE